MTGGPSTIHTGQSANLQCNGSEPGWPIGHFAPNAPTGKNGMGLGRDFTYSGGAPGDSLRITLLSGAIHGGVIKIYCELRDNNDPTHVTSSNYELTAVVP